MGRRGLRDAVLEILDGGGNSVTVKIGRGTFSWIEKRDVKYTRNKGQLLEVMLADDPATEVTLSFNWEWLSNITGISLYQAIKCEAPGWVTTGDQCDPDCVDLRLTLTPENCGSVSEVIDFHQFRTDTRNPELREGRIYCKGTVMSVLAYNGSETGWGWIPFIPGQNINVIGHF
jgi:hypothetical protein